MSYLTHSAFLKKVSELNSNYWNEGKKYRWQYMDYVIQQAKAISPYGSCIIEAGTSGMPLNCKSFLFEYPTYNLDVIPYEYKTLGKPVKILDKEFDIFIALQVFEHLDNQSQAFQEVMRISKSAILSFPYKWTWGDPMHKGIDDRKISKWTCGVKPESVKIINHRKICVWRF